MKKQQPVLDYAVNLFCMHMCLLYFLRVVIYLSRLQKCLTVVGN